MDLLINAENIEQVCLRLSTIDKNYVWLEEKRQEIVRKWWREEIIPFKPAWFYYNGNYNSPLENYSTVRNLLIDTENKKIKRKAELFIKYNNGEYQHYYFNSDEDAKTAFNEIKSKTNLLLINFVSE
jgi:hypothetical protein